MPPSPPMEKFVVDVGVPGLKGARLPLLRNCWPRPGPETINPPGAVLLWRILVTSIYGLAVVPAPTIDVPRLPSGRVAASGSAARSRYSTLQIRWPPARFSPPAAPRFKDRASPYSEM